MCVFSYLHNKQRLFLQTELTGESFLTETGYVYCVLGFEFFMSHLDEFYFIYVFQQDTQCFMSKFIHNIYLLDMFWTSIVHLQKRFQTVCCKFGMWYFAYYSIRPDVITTA